MNTMKKIKKLMKEQIEYMFLHDGERNEDINNRISDLIDEYCGDVFDSDDCLDKLAEVHETWKDLVLTRYNFLVNEILASSPSPFK
jgi:hypothetical protein